MKLTINTDDLSMKEMELIKSEFPHTIVEITIRTSEEKENIFNDSANAKE
jgi:hypothetical protein